VSGPQLPAGAGTAGSEEDHGRADDGPTRCGFAAVVGAPNVGKSTLVNRLVGTKVSIVSPKRQTTRMRILGIVLRGPAQIVLVDTPGLFEPRHRLDRAMVAAAWAAMADADRIVLMVDSTRGRDQAVDAVVQWLGRERRRAQAVLNKVDAVAKPRLLALAADLHATGVLDPILMISARNGDGVDDLAARLAEDMPAGPWLFAADDISDLPLAFLAAEITREKIYWQVHEELPYASAVRTERLEEMADGSIRIEQSIAVERDGQKAILIGKGGTRIKAIGAAAREELGALLDRRVHLFLRVEVRERWRDGTESWRWHRLERPR
jgi:GTP-binding protein Era